MDWAMTYVTPKGFAFTDIAHFAVELKQFFCSQRPI
jgi:hypothetical protein